MKNNTFFSLLLIGSFSFLMGCSKDNVNQSANQSEIYQNLQGADYLNYYNTPDVFFNFAKVDESTQMINGWIIDINGTVSTYEISTEFFPVADPILHKTKLSSIINIAEVTSTTIDLNELVDFYKKTRLAANGDFEYSHEPQDQSISIYINAYDLQLGNGACLNCPVSQVSENERAQLVLKAEGIIAGFIDHPDAEDIVAWMNAINAGL